MKEFGNENICIGTPVKFNPLKHHRDFILEFLEKSSSDELQELLSVICNNYIDIYTGSLTPEEICQAVISHLKSENAFPEEAFNQWVSLSDNYRHIKLGDNSEWIVRKGDNAAQYIHIHPAKTGAGTIRFKGSTLKTAFTLKHVFLHNEYQNLTLDMVNRAREAVSLSPVKKLEKGKGIMNCWETFFK